jgi:hypothetical protein
LPRTNNGGDALDRQQKSVGASSPQQTLAPTMTAQHYPSIGISSDKSVNFFQDDTHIGEYFDF